MGRRGAGWPKQTHLGGARIRESVRVWFSTEGCQPHSFHLVFREQKLKGKEAHHKQASWRLVPWGDGMSREIHQDCVAVMDFKGI